MHELRPVERRDDPQNRPPAKVNLVECSACHFPVPESELSVFTGRRMCRNCIAGWFEDDDAEEVDSGDQK